MGNFQRFIVGMVVVVSGGKESTGWVCFRKSEKKTSRVSRVKIRLDRLVSKLPNQITSRHLIQEKC